MSSNAIADTPLPSDSVSGVAPEASVHIAHLFHALVEGAREYGIFLLDPDGFVASWNGGAARLEGYTETEIIGRHFSCFYTPEAVQDGRPALALEKALAAGKYHEEGWRVRKDGSRFWANVLITPVWDHTGNLAGFAKLVQDATETWQARASLLESEQRYARLFANQLTAIAQCRVIVDELGQPIDYVVLRINDAYERIIGIRRADIEGRRIKEVFPDIDSWGFDYIRTLGRVALDRTEFSACTKVEATGQAIAIYAYSLLPGEFTAMFSDITENMRAEAALRRSELAFRSMAEATPQIVWTAGPDGTPNYCNKRWYDFTGYSEETALAGWLAIVHPEEKEQAACLWLAALHSQRVFELQCRFWDQNHETYRWFLVRAVPFDDDLPTGAHWLGTCTDIDDYKRLSDDLEARVNERTMALQQSILEKTMLLKEVHHRVKNNLQVVCSLLSMQIRNMDQKYSSPLIAAHSRALAMSLVHEQVYQSQNVANLDFGRYIEQLAEQVFSAYCVDPNRIRLERNIEPISLSIEDAVPCGLILNELLSNSLKHAFPVQGFQDDRPGVIRVSFRRTEGEQVECSVSDNGPGFPPDFDSRQSQSLGMQIVSSLIRQLRADFATSSEGGAMIRFRWKCANPAAENLQGQQQT